MLGKTHESNLADAVTRKSSDHHPASFCRVKAGTLSLLSMLKEGKEGMKKKACFSSPCQCTP